MQLKQALVFLPAENVDIFYPILFPLLKCCSWTTKKLIPQAPSVLWTAARKTWGQGGKESWAYPLPHVLSSQIHIEHLNHSGYSLGQGWVSEVKGWMLGEAHALEQSKRQESGSGGSSPEEKRPQASKELLEATLSLRNTLLFLRSSTDLQWWPRGGKIHLLLWHSASPNHIFALRYSWCTWSSFPQHSAWHSWPSNNRATIQQSVQISPFPLHRSPWGIAWLCRVVPVGRTWMSWHVGSTWDLSAGRCSAEGPKEDLCYGLNVCVLCWNPNPSSDGGVRRWGLWKMIRIRWGYKGGAPVMPSMSLREERKRDFASILGHMRNWEGGNVQLGRGASPNSTTLAPWSWTPSLHTVRIKLQFISHPI